jgi:hypothetical protein
MEHLDDLDLLPAHAVHNTVGRFHQLTNAPPPVPVDSLSEIWERRQLVATLQESIDRTGCRIHGFGGDVIVNVGQRS